MLHIVMLVLKIIGIIIAIALGIILLCLGVVLFVPIRYKLETESENTLADVRMHLKFSWLLHVVSGYVDYETSKLTWQLRAFWKKINKEKKAKEEDIIQNDIKVNKESVKIDRKEEIDEDLDEYVSISNESVDNKKAKTNLFKKIKYTILNICDKIKLLINKKNQLKEFLENKTHQLAWKDLKREFIFLCKVIKPRKLVGNIEFGFEDPSLTGKVLAGLSVLYPFYPDTIVICPNFTQEIFCGKITAKGKIRGIHLLRVLLKIYFNKKIVKTYKAIKKLKD